MVLVLNNYNDNNVFSFSRDTSSTRVNINTYSKYGLVSNTNITFEFYETCFESRLVFILNYGSIQIMVENKC